MTALPPSCGWNIRYSGWRQKYYTRPSEVVQKTKTELMELNKNNLGTLSRENRTERRKKHMNKVHKSRQIELFFFSLFFCWCI